MKSIKKTESPCLEDKRVEIIQQQVQNKQPANIATPSRTKPPKNESIKIKLRYLSESIEDNEDLPDCNHNQEMPSDNSLKVTGERFLITIITTFRQPKSSWTNKFSTFAFILPRVRFFKRADEIEKNKAVTKQRNEYRTLKSIDKSEDLTISNICPRDVRPQDIFECRIQKYDVVGYVMPYEMEEYTCRDDDF
ncbi:unnamed protein product [Thelazia callipaeda]|uniref:Uncharacterized protein n=1 Tax=Thelazia callipaeda TaxID=103827 RepID=A0A0N5D100_THECL|nr:unnamed protein product [Thelazia callipaeda]